ncbi:MAG: alginate lyase family protein [Chlamydiales bacterium]
MKTFQTVKRVLRLPPHIVLQKIVRKLTNAYRTQKKRYLDQRFPTYARHCPADRLRRFVKKIPPPALAPHLNGHTLNHEFNLLGSGWVKVFHGMACKGIDPVNQQNVPESDRIRSLIKEPYLPIDWQIDFKSGYRWSAQTWSQDIQYGNQRSADVKLPWELSRMQHLTLLAWGYAAENRSIYLDEFQNQILDFIASNPPRYGVNWSCTMDVGIRIANWLIAYDLFAAHGAPLDPSFEQVFFRSVYEHGHHIRHHLEWDPYLRSNHYLANIAGLLFAAAYLAIDSWFDFALRELIREVLTQFHSDGGNFEASSCYHRLSAEMVVYATALALDRGALFPKEYLDRLEKMGDFIRDTTKPDGTIVQCGDNDSGRFIKIFPDAHLLSALRDVKGLSSVIESQFMNNKEDAKSGAYPHFGLYIENRDPWYVAIRCGAVGQKGNGGHAHNDQLSFELSVHGVSMLIDPGTYVYTPLPEARRYFRSTAMHNTLAAGEQNPNEELFRLPDRAKGRVLQFGPGIFIGEHEGFGKIHQRELRIKGDRIEGIDTFDGMAEIYFHFAPGWIGTQIDDRRVEWVFETIRVHFYTDQGAWKCTQSEYSSAYGEKKLSPLLILTGACQSTSWRISIY